MTLGETMIITVIITKIRNSNPLKLSHEVFMILLIEIYLLFTYLFTFDEDNEPDCHIGCTKNCEHCIYDAK